MSDNDVVSTSPVRWWRRPIVLMLVGAVVVTLFGGWLVLREAVQGRACETIGLLVPKDGFSAEEAAANPSTGYRSPTYAEALAAGIPEHCARLFYRDQ